MIDKIIDFSCCESFVLLENTVGQRWYFPCQGMRRYMSLFQPSSIAGSLAAKALPVAKGVPALLRVMHAERVQISVRADLLHEIAQAFGVDSVQCGVFAGTPGRHQKPTLIVLHHDEILGYTKVTDSSAVAEIFCREERTLRRLHEQGVADIPQVVCCRQSTSLPGAWLFCQTTERRHRVSIPRFTSPEVMAFVEQMLAATAVDVPLADSDFGAMLSRLETLASLTADKAMTDTIIDEIAAVRTAMAEGTHRFAAYHGDLTPWNSFIVDNHLFAFDFEYAQTTYTPYADFFHFFTQSMIYDYNADAAHIYSEYRKLTATTLRHVDRPALLYRCYILAIMEFYLQRDRGFLNDRIRQIFGIWCQLLKKIEDDQRGGVNQILSIGLFQRLKARILFLIREYL